MPESVVIDAIRLALAVDIADESEASVLAALSQHWLGSRSRAPLNEADVDEIETPSECPRTLNASTSAWILGPWASGALRP